MFVEVGRLFIRAEAAEVRRGSARLLGREGGAEDIVVATREHRAEKLAASTNNAALFPWVGLLECSQHYYGSMWASDHRGVDAPGNRVSVNVKAPVGQRSPGNADDNDPNAVQV